MYISACTTLAKSTHIGSVDYKFRAIGPNDKIVVESFRDPLIDNVMCYISRATTGGISGALGLQEDVEEASIACWQRGPIVLPESVLNGAKNGVKVFEKDISPLFKTLQVVRFYDANINALIYLAYSDKVFDGSPNSSLSSFLIQPWL